MSFVNTFFLAALGAMALPVLFHFVRKMRAKTVPFSSLMFLSATPQERVKRRRLRDVLLMTLRALVLGLLALAFARPLVPPEQLPFAASEEAESVVYLLDASYSMQGLGMFESARDQVAARIEAADRGDESAVVTFSDFAEQLTGFDSDDALHADVVRSVVSPTNRTTDFFEPLQMAAELLRSARNEQRRVVLVSDLQRAGWSGSLENWKLDPGTAFEPIKVVPEADVNYFFGDVSVRVRRIGNEAVVQVDGRVEQAISSSAAALEPGEVSVEIALNNRIVESASVDLRNSQRFSFRRIADRNGFVQGELTLAPDREDALGVDNTYYFTYQVDDRPAVLVVDGSSRVQSGLIRSDGYFLEKAFAPGVGDRDIAPYAIEVRGRDRLRAIPASTELVFVTNLPSLNAREVEAITRYVEQGGNVVISFGDNVDVAGYSAALRDLGIGEPIAVVSPRSVQSGNAIVGQVDWRHPVFAPFAGPGGGAILKPEFRRYVAINPENGAQVVGTFDSGEPFLVERRLGGGSVLVFASTFGNAWTDFPINEMFVPFVYQLARHATTDDRRPLMYTVGENVALSGPSSSTWEVRAPGGEVYRVAADSLGLAYFARTDQVGQYVAARGATRIPFSVNLDRSESLLEARDEEEAYAGVVSPAVAQPNYVREAALTTLAEEKKQKLWRWLILAAIAFFAIETWLANRPGLRRRQ